MMSHFGFQDKASSAPEDHGQDHKAAARHAEQHAG
jgi:hypothetical protein